MSTDSICIIGCGKMGEAILSGWLGHGVPAEKFTVIEPDPDRAKEIATLHGVKVATALSDAEPAEMYVIAVKPQVIDGVLEDLADAVEKGDAAPLVVSIAAGVPTSRISAALPDGTRVVRTMPNTPLMVGEGATVVAFGPNATQDDLNFVRDMFAELGVAEIVSEDQIDAVCAVSGGGPAYFAAMVEALADAGAAQGLDSELAEHLALQTATGMFEMIRKTGASVAETREAVCSPGGTTLAALGAMAEAGFQESIQAGIAAAMKRAKELA